MVEDIAILFYSSGYSLVIYNMWIDMEFCAVVKLRMHVSNISMGTRFQKHGVAIDFVNLRYTTYIQYTYNTRIDSNMNYYYYDLQNYVQYAISTIRG